MIAAEWPGRLGSLSPETVRRYPFERTSLGRRGYVESDVERFQARVADEIARGDAEKADLRAEIGRLRNYFRDRGIDADPATRRRRGERHGGRATGTGPVDVQAVNLLSQAQQAADQHIAAAESYARMLVQDARRQYEDILVRAHERAEDAAARAGDEYAAMTALGDRQEEQAELAAKLAYLRTFAEVTQVQMRSILDALRQELDRLAEVNTAAPTPAPPTAPTPTAPTPTALPPTATPTPLTVTTSLLAPPSGTDPAAPGGAGPAGSPVVTLPPDDQSRPAALSAR